MSDSLRDQLLGLGYKPAPNKPAPSKPAPSKPAPSKPAPSKPAPSKPAPKRSGKPSRNKTDGRNSDGRKPDVRRQGHKASTRGKPGHRDTSRKPGHAKGGARDARAGEMDLGKAYAIRAQTEKHERIEAERTKQEEARLRREARARLVELLDGKALNDETADIARHFQYGDKIKRIHVTAPQLKALNAGELGVVQLNGRYLLVEAQVLVQAEETFPVAVALKVNPDAPTQEDPYSDPSYQVPDDLVW